MSYSIIPPIVLIISLIGIILFLVKKASKVALLEDTDKKPENASDSETISEKKGFFRRKISWSNGEGKDLNHGFLFFLEKFTRKLRVFFLRLENIFTQWSENLRKKRRDRIEAASLEEERKKEERFIANRNIAGRDDIYEENNMYGSERDIQKPVEFQAGERKIIRPIISEKVVIPRVKPEIKNRLERVLIERIAANPKDTEAYERLGEYYFEIENYQHAKECFKQVVKLDPMNDNVKDKMRKLERLLSVRR